MNPHDEAIRRMNGTERWSPREVAADMKISLSVLNKLRMMAEKRGYLPPERAPVLETYWAPWLTQPTGGEKWDRRVTA